MEGTEEDLATPPRVLFVDDEAEIRRPACDLLTAAGFEVVEAVDGEDALEKIRSGGGFDALITDLRMPRMNGYELLELVSEKYPELAAATIVISGFVDSAASLPPHFVMLRKPCDTTHLMDALAACAVRQRTRAARIEN